MKNRLTLLIAAALLLASCKSQEKPVLEFVGVSTGTLATDIRTLSFRDKFDVDDKQILGAAQFSKIENGTKVQATWFSPDDRKMPLGRTVLETSSGAKLVRFSIESKDPWPKSPYMLLIDTLDDKGQITASGSVHFFMGMTDKEIQEYAKELEAWKEEEQKQREAAEKAASASSKGEKTGSGNLIP